MDRLKQLCVVLPVLEAFIHGSLVAIAAALLAKSTPNPYVTIGAGLVAALKLWAPSPNPKFSSSPCKDKS